MSGDRRELDESIEKFMHEDGMDGIIVDYVLLVNFVPSNGEDASGFYIQYKNGTLNWAQAFGMHKVWGMRLESDYRESDERG